MIFGNKSMLFEVFSFLTFQFYKCVRLIRTTGFNLNLQEQESNPGLLSQMATILTKGQHKSISLVFKWNRLKFEKSD